MANVENQCGPDTLSLSVKNQHFPSGEDSTEGLHLNGQRKVLKLNSKCCDFDRENSSEFTFSEIKAFELSLVLSHKPKA